MPIVNKGTLVYVCETPQNSDLTPTAFAALSYDELCCVVTAPSLPESYAQLTAMCLSGTKHVAVGAAEDAEAEIEVYYEANCDGQDTLRDNVGKADNYAFKVVRTDGSATQTPTTIYFRGKIRAKNLGSNGGADEWTTDTYTVIIQQGPILVKPVPIP